MYKDLTWIEVSKKRIENNIRMIRQVIGPKVLLAPCIKANAYGLGIENIAQLLSDCKVDGFCVNSLQEATSLRQIGIRKPILVMGYIPEDDLQQIIDLRLRVFISDYLTAKKLNQLAQKSKQKVLIHLKIDTGMHRLGVLVSEAKDLITELKKLENLSLEGIATHFATADEETKKMYFRKQLKAFQDLLKELKKNGIKFPLIHSANSAALLETKNSHFDLVRPGLAIYGYYPNVSSKKKCLQRKIKLLPALTWKTRVSLVKTIPAQSYVGYGATFRTVNKTKIAVLPVGYYDGFDRRLSNRGFVLIKGKRVPVRGRVCMNMIIVEVNKIRNIFQGEEVVLLGQQGKEEITVEELAKACNTIDDEIIARLRETIPRYIVK
jgi:alanine racemase